VHVGVGGAGACRRRRAADSRLERKGPFTMHNARHAYCVRVHVRTPTHASARAGALAGNFGSGRAGALGGSAAAAAAAAATATAAASSPPPDLTTVRRPGGPAAQVCVCARARMYMCPLECVRAQSCICVHVCVCVSRLSVCVCALVCTRACVSFWEMGTWQLLYIYIYIYIISSSPPYQRAHNFIGAAAPLHFISYDTSYIHDMK
jgi:hypothetical protein